jgi:hypothetical protein
MDRGDDGKVNKLPPALQKLPRWDNSHEHWDAQPDTTGRCVILLPLAASEPEGLSGLY